MLANYSMHYYESPILSADYYGLFATKIAQLHVVYGPDVEFILFLCGYFDSGYLGYEAAEGIDWIWEHRIGDLDQLGI